MEIYVVIIVDYNQLVQYLQFGSGNYCPFR